MKLVLEKDFIDCLLKSPNKTDKEKDLNNFLKEDCTGYELICDISSYDEYISLSKKNPLYEILLDKFTTIEYDSNLKERIENESLFSDYNGRVIYFTNIPTLKADTYTKKYGHIVVTHRNIETSWDLAYQFRKNLKFMVTQSKSIPSENRIDCWNKFSNFSHPFRNMIIFDKHLLKNTTPSQLKTNLIPLIENILAKNQKEIKTNVTIISETKIGFTLKNYISILENHFKDTVAFNIIRHSKALYPIKLEGFHSRFILTDYVRIVPDNTFNLFKSNNTVNSVTNIFCSFSFCSSTKSFFDKDCEDLKLYLSKVNNEPKGDEKFRDMYFPHKNNYLLN